MTIEDKDIQLFQESIRRLARYDFEDYSITSLRRRLTRILLEFDMDMAQLTRKMESDPGFLEKIVRKITVHTTELFRDPGIWIELEKAFLERFRNQDRIHIWHSGCSTGQEVYSMMMLLDHLDLLDRSRIFASDLNPDVLETAREGKYRYRFNQSYLENFDRVILGGDGQTGRAQKKSWKKYFHIDESRDIIQMKDFLRMKPDYKVLDLVHDDNLFEQEFDVIMCRNVIIYFNTKLQNRVFKLFHTNLKEDGMLILGVHESILGPATHKFRKTDPFYVKR
ncbi:MAG: CheR family methyltransferase [Bacteroidales bacterium]